MNLWKITSLYPNTLFETKRNILSKEKVQKIPVNMIRFEYNRDFRQASLLNTNNSNEIYESNII